VAGADETIFEVQTPLEFRVRLPAAVWKVICELKHPVMAGRQLEVSRVLSEPDGVRRSQLDSDVYLFYKRERPDRWLCVVAKRLDGDGFVITSYPTDAIKIGEQIWTK